METGAMGYQEAAVMAAACGTAAEEPPPVTASLRRCRPPAPSCLCVFMLEVKGQRLTLINLIVTLGVIVI